MIAWIVLLVFILLLQFEFLRSILFFKNISKPKDQNIREDDFPFISIILAARNEAVYIENCLRSISLIDYPISKIEVLIGNDQSTDNTSEIISKFIGGKSNFHLFEINQNKGKARGKANVLAQLCYVAKGDFLFFTDADTIVNPQWIRAYLPAFDSITGMVSATSRIETKNNQGIWQSLEWLYILGIFKAMDLHSMPISSVGNNMAVRRSAYQETGGFANFNFSITEDYKLFTEIRKRGWGFKTLFNPESLNITHPAKNLQDFLRQKKRWMTGALELPMYQKVLLFLNLIYLPLAIYVGTEYWEFAVVFIAVKVLSDGWLLLGMANRLAIKIPTLHAFIFTFYHFVSGMTAAIYFVFGGKVIWKGREF